MKKISLLFLLVLLLLPVGVFAGTGDGNMGSAGGGTGDKTDHGFWNVGDDGVRVSIVRISDRAVVGTADFSNATGFITNHAADIRHFGKKTKFAYKVNVTLSRVIGNYKPYTISGMPTIVNKSGGNNIAAIRTFFTKENTVRYVADTLGMDYDTLVGGEYKLLIEPIAYFKYEGIFYAMTATEAAIFDPMTSGQLKYWMGTVTHQNLPLALFLEKDDTDLRLNKWTGKTSGKQSNANIMDFLGMGIVTFAERIIEAEVEGDYGFRTDTDVIVAIQLKSSGTITPDNGAYLDIDIGGKKFSKRFVCPSGGTQLVWIKWHTPDTPQDVPIHVTCSAIPSLNKQLNAHIVELVENVPPDPTFYDSNPSFKYEKPTGYGNRTSTQWGEWNCYWVPPPDEDSSGYWEFEYLTYSASLYSKFSIKPDGSVPTAYQSAGRWIMGSGYGINVEMETSVSASSGSLQDYCPVQNVVTVFSEFAYHDYNRLLESKYNRATMFKNQKWQFKENLYSYYHSPLHFTPLWYPDGQYTVQAVALDAWTPGGMLYASAADSLEIFRSCLDDWYIQRTK